MTDIFFEHEHFHDKVGDTFTVTGTLHTNDDEEVSEKTINFTLTKCDATTIHEFPNRKRDPFSLIFDGPREFVLEQRIYPLVHETLGECSLFLVPIGQTEDATQYQAVFT